MIVSRQTVPEYYGRSRDYQVFLSLLDIVINAVYADTEYYTSLISPDHCKARMLPFLSNYVGYTYDFSEPVKMNRIITKNWCSMKRLRGSIAGIRMAAALAMNQIEDADSADIFKMFNVDIENYKDKYGRHKSKIKLYVYHQSYLSKLYDLIEAVRPAGTELEVIPAIPIDASETIVLSDEFLMSVYDYTTGKLIRVGDVPIYIENSWQIMYDGQPTNEYLVDNIFYDQYHNMLDYDIDDKQRVRCISTNTLTGEIIKAPYIYKVVEYQPGTAPEYRYRDPDTSEYKTLIPTGKYFNLEHSARVLNTCYKLYSGGVETNYYVLADSGDITNSDHTQCYYRLKDYNLNGIIVKKVYGRTSDVMYNWHVDPDSGRFIQDNVGNNIGSQNFPICWDEHCYLTKKRFIMNTTVDGLFFATNYYVNNNEDIQDQAGNIILSKKDRYKVSDSSHIGFSEVHSMDKSTTYDKSFVTSRQQTYSMDRDYFNQQKPDFNDYFSSEVYVDDRIKIRPSDIKIDPIIREYDGTNKIGDLNASADVIVMGNRAQIPVSCIDGNVQNMSTSYITIDVALKNDDDFLSVFSEVSFRFDTEHIGSNKPVMMTWKLAEHAEQTYNVFELPETLVFSGKGTILPRTLKFTSEPINLSSKVYDGTVDISSQSIITDVDSEE